MGITIQLYHYMISIIYLCLPVKLTMPGMFSQPRGDTPGLLDLLRLCIGGGLRWNSTGGFLRRLRGGEKRLGEPWWDWNHWEMRLFNIKWWLFLLGYHIILNICLKTNLNTALYWFQHISTEIQLLCLMVSFFFNRCSPHIQWMGDWGLPSSFSSPSFFPSSSCVPLVWFVKTDVNRG